MLDDRNLQDHPPFDASSIETELSSLIPRRTPPLPRPSLRRNPADPYSPPAEPTTPHGAEMEESSGAKDSTAALLDERESTHGSFDENARVWQLLCDQARETKFDSDRQRLAFAMIALKLARLLQNPTVRDHWDDIAGYARLGADGC